MNIVGEKINGTRKSVGKAIAARDADFIRNLAIKQVDGGACWLDINAGTRPDCEPDDLLWLVNLVQEVTEVPLCLDSANPKALRYVMPAVKKTPLINSISGEPSRLEGILPIVAEFNCPVIALCMDDRGIPADSEGRMSVIRKVFEETRKGGILDKDMYVDPLAMTIATNTNAGNIIFETMRRIRTEFPEAHISCGLSNVSFGLPYRSLINRTFMVLALQAGMDTALIDPNDRDLVSAIYATELLLGKDRHCLNYTRAYRSGKIGLAEKI